MKKFKWTNIKLRVNDKTEEDGLYEILYNYKEYRKSVDKNGMVINGDITLRNHEYKNATIKMYFSTTEHARTFYLMAKENGHL